METYKKSYLKFILCIVLSLLTYIMSNGVWSIPIFAWVYPILFLSMLHFDGSIKTYFIIISIYAIGFNLQFADMIGIDIWTCVLVSISIALLKTLPYFYWMKSKMTFKSTITFAAFMLIVEYLIYLIYPILGGLSDAYTQYSNLYLIQIVTVTGIYGITFIIYWTAAILIWIWKNRSNLNPIKKYILFYSTIMTIVFFYGIIMFQFWKDPEKSVRAAGITVPISHLLNEDNDIYSVFYTDSFTDENIVNTNRKLMKVTDALFLKTVQEAQAGAKIVFWSELNGAVLKNSETALLKKASDIAKEQKIYLIVSLLVKTPYEDLKENKVAAFNPQGKKILEYFKYGRSIGELCQKGNGTLKSFDTKYGKIAPFICSDMAFCSKIQQAGKKNVDILIVPASDWKEMTQIALKTAVVRGVENGCNIIRHTNRGKSIVSDSKGNILALSDYFQSDTKTLASQVLTKGRFTLYSQIGDIFVYLCGNYLLVIFFFQMKAIKNSLLNNYK